MTIQTPPGNISTFAVYDMLDPTEGPRICRAIVPLDTDGKGVISLNAPNIQFNSCQGVYVDNPSVATIEVKHVTTGFRIVALPQTQGWYQMESTDDMTFAVTSSVAAAATVQMQFSNTETHTTVTQTVSSAAALDAQMRQRVVVEGTPAVAPVATGAGATPFARNTTASTNAALINSGARNVVSVTVWNSSATAQWLKLFSKTTAPVLGTDTPIYNIMVPAGASLNFELGPIGVTCSGLGVAMTAGGALLDATALGAADTSGFTIAWK